MPASFEIARTAQRCFLMLLPIPLLQSRFQDSLLGKLQIPVADIARNGHLKDTWALQEAESGSIEMKLQWQNCYVDQYVD